MRRVYDLKLFTGKTIQSANIDHHNSEITINFTDGTTAKIWTNIFGVTQVEITEGTLKNMAY